MLRWLGAGLILCGGLLIRRTLLDGGRLAQRTRRELAAAFETMEAEIRLLLTPIPKLLRRPCGEKAGDFFTQVSQGLTCGRPLPEAWRYAAGQLPLPEDEREAITAMGTRLGGAEESACAALTLAAAMLRKRFEEFERRQAQQERLTTSICISISLFLAICLF